MQKNSLIFYNFCYTVNNLTFFAIYFCVAVVLLVVFFHFHMNLFLSFPFDFCPTNWHFQFEFQIPIRSFYFLLLLLLSFYVRLLFLSFFLSFYNLPYRVFLLRIVSSISVSNQFVSKNSISFEQHNCSISRFCWGLIEKLSSWAHGVGKFNQFNQFWLFLMTPLVWRIWELLKIIKTRNWNRAAEDINNIVKWQLANDWVTLSSVTLIWKKKPNQKCYFWNI